MKIWKIVFLLEFLVITSLLLAILSFNNKKFQIIACDVGQGDAILAIYGDIQILTDGGPDSKVLDCLGAYIPFWDNTIELVILTHPDKDHFGGLIDVFERYEVLSFLKTKATSSNQSYQVLESIVGGKEVDTIYASDSLSIRLGKIYLDILNPIDSNEVSIEDKNLNNSSIVSVLKFGNFEALLTGDIEIEGINRLIMEGKIHDVDYLKVPHHGSKNNITSGLLRFSSPEVAVISVGKNSYGHPNKEVLDLLNKLNIRVLRTDELGSILIEVNKEGQFYLD
ncbi:hypothetical protein KJ570_03960 [Patescibacteria group bacterium]|nr:hypothetical protein [Patescibacteria group bacterium]MBU2036138.1 hypothetical protein [Patescibacteria group bacterium]